MTKRTITILAKTKKIKYRASCFRKGKTLDKEKTMKKKGLIISTVVMVVVLIASLTTATYAWFTATAETTIEKIDFSVSSGSDVSIGLSSNNSYQTGASSSAFRSGTTTIGAAFAATDDQGTSVPSAVLQAGENYWEGSNGLGNRIDMQLSLTNMTKAVGTGKSGATADSAFNLAAIRTLATADNTGMIISEGLATEASKNGSSPAYGQKDYLDVVIGVQAAAADLYSIICNVTINPNSNDIDLGMNAAIHVAWAIDGMIGANTPSDQVVDAYGDNHYNKTTASLAKTLVGGRSNTAYFGGNETQTLNNGATNIPITIAESSTKTGTDYLDRSKIYQIHLLIWIDGNDGDCNDQAKGVSSSIYINFGTTHATRTSA